MMNEQALAPARDIPVPPGGGSWRFEESVWAWVSNDPAPAADVTVVTDAAAPDQVAAPTIEQE